MKKIYFIFIGLLLIVNSSCDDFLDADPNDSIPENKFWQSESDLTKFVTDIYASSFPVDNEGAIFFDESMSDNSYMVWDGWYTDVKLVANGTQDAYGTTPQNLWTNYYASIRKCAQVFANVDKMMELDEKVKNRLLAETKCLMAWDYYRLISFFGDVPLVTEVLTIEESKELTRQPVNDIVTQILTWLDESSSVLEGEKQERGRITWGACQLLKARVYLLQNNYQAALDVVDGLIGKYSLYKDGETPYADLFSGDAEDASEIILSIVREKSSGSIATGHNANQLSYHEVDSSEMAFKIAGSMAFKNAMKKADPVLLEPIMKVTVITPEEYLGDVIGDLNSRRGMIQSMEADNGVQRVIAHVPLSEMFGYATDMRSKTQGRGQYVMEPDTYAEVPKNIAEKIMSERAKKD